MSEERRDENQTGEKNLDGSSDDKAASGVTRRDFIQQTVAVASGLALSSLLPAFASELHAEAAPEPHAAALPAACQTGQPLQPIMEIERTHDTQTLQAVIKVLNEKKSYLAPPSSSPVCNSGQMRYFSGYNLAKPGKVWPNDYPNMMGGPTPGPTLRARIGDRVEITLLNQVNVSDFANTLDVAEHGQGCDVAKSVGPDGVALNTYPGDPSFEHPPDCFHGSSSTNLHYHGTHVSPNSIADFVLANTRPSPRDKATGKPIVDEKFVESDFKEIFRMCSHGHTPQLWGELPKTWQETQERLLKEYDLTASWKGVNGPVDGKPALPLSERLWPKNERAIESRTWPQYYIGAYPSCFKLPVWKKDDPQSPVMGQAPGTHWYHSHKHGSTALNLANGMAGALIIEGDYDDVLKPFFTTQQVLVIQQFGAQINLLKNGINDQGQANKNISGDLVFVNGQYQPVLHMNPNEMQLWRLVNACHQKPIPLSAPTGIQWVQTAQDGVQLHQKNYNPAVTNAAISVPAVAASGGQTGGTLAAGNRVDFLVLAPQAEGSYQVKFGNTVLLTVQVKQDPKVPVIKSPMPFPTQAEFPIMPEFLWDIDPAKVRVRRELRFASVADPSSPKPAQNRGTKGPSFPPPKHMIDGKQFDNTIDQSMVLGATEEWTMYNDSPGAAHPFHIHINPFQVVEILNPAISKNPVKLPQPWVWFDDFAIPPAAIPPDGDGKTMVSGYFKMLTRFVDFAGIYVLHCHILGHEDRGMMQLVQVVSNSTPLEHH
jgi:FtsP/CotA-like multicopper oxidase with cupredoxin domain